MNKDRSWSDWLDPEKVQKGNYTLYRNYIENGQFIYYPYSKENEDYIGHTTPVALGITAFLVGDDHGSDYVKCFLAKGKKFDTIQTYSLYFNGCLREYLIEKKSQPFPEDDEDLKQKFITEHTDQEKKNYRLSDRYFKEFKDEQDKQLNEKVNEYVEGYFRWLETLAVNKSISDPLDQELIEQQPTIIAESIVMKLWETFNESFPSENIRTWRKRWINDKSTLTPISISNFKKGNNKHLLLAILYESRTVMDINEMDDYVKRRWGLLSYRSDLSRHLTKNPHPDKSKIQKILKPE